MNKFTSSKTGSNANSAKYCQKFNDAKSLEKAYIELERDYTRKCQELASYKKLNFREVNFKEGESIKDILTDELKNSESLDGREQVPEISAENDNLPSEEKVLNETSGDEKVENSSEIVENSDEKVENGTKIVENHKIYESDDWNEKVLDFFMSHPDAKEISGDIAKVLYDDEGISKLSNGLEVAYSLARSKRLVSPEKVLSDPKFIEEKVITSDEIKERVLDSFLGGIINRNNSIPAYGVKSGGSFVSSPKKIKTLEDARDILLRHFTAT